MKGNQSIETLQSTRSKALLAELKELVDSLPEEQRKEVVRVLRTVFTRLNSVEAEESFE